ncbi:MAG: VCBS repeat-containing protein, partial [Lysobacterales bacterium]
GFVWRRAGGGSETISPKDIDKSFAEIISFRMSKDGTHVLTFPNKAKISINPTDIRQYGTVAYSLRAILAVQQDSMMDPEQEPLGLLAGEALETLKQKMDLATLALLQEADAYARAHSEYEISLENINRAWLALFKIKEEDTTTVTAAVSFRADRPPLMEKIIQQKVASYAQYNEMSNQLFIRNMQVYFARLSWPLDTAEAEAFRAGFIDALVGYGIELYKGVVDVAATNNSQVVQEEHVARFVQHFTPYRVNEYEDIQYFPNLPDGKITLEAYDLDAFRDSGVHWVYLGYALESPEITQFLDVDPFAAELLAENVAQFGVLILREAGLQGVKNGEERLSLELLAAAMQNVQGKVNANLANESNANTAQAEIRSVDAENSPEREDSSTWFTDRTKPVGLNAMHRSSDWLNRLLRSYLRRDENTGIITIPPAFGGSGVAAGDINNDGFPDILLLSGLGNRLFINDTKGGFSDQTSEAGLVYLRPEDNHPGEPRQPLIADLNNDGWQDIVITYVDDNHRVYMNNGDGTFKDMTSKAALGGKGLVGGPATVFDYDNDGLLDIYVTYFGDYIHGILPTLSRVNNNGLPNKLFRNLGDFQFKEVKAGVEDSGWGQAVTHTDFNVDGLQDLIVGNDFGTNVYYQNLGNGKFKDVSAELGVDKPSYT